jgi:hypothetical protein
MAILTQSDLPITDKLINGSGTVKCQVSGGNVFITIKRNGFKTVNNQKFSSAQGFSHSMDTTVDTAIWLIDVNGDALSAFILTIPD